MTKRRHDKDSSKSPDVASTKKKAVYRFCRAKPWSNCEKRWQGAFKGYCSKCSKLYGEGDPTAQPEAKRNNNERSPGDDVDVNINGSRTNAARATNQPEINNTTFARGINEIAITDANIHNNSIDGETGGFENERQSSFCYDKRR